MIFIDVKRNLACLIDWAKVMLWGRFRASGLYYVLG